MQECTIVLIKPDAVERGLEDKIIDIFLNNEFELVGLKRLTPQPKDIATHLGYDKDFKTHLGQKIQSLFADNQMAQEETFLAGQSVDAIGSFYHDRIVDYLSNGTMIGMILQGDEAISRAKKLCGATFPANADKKSIRGLFGTDSFADIVREKRAPHNIIHAAEDETEANHQIALWFPEFKLECA